MNIKQQAEYLLGVVDDLEPYYELETMTFASHPSADMIRVRIVRLAAELAETILKGENE